jgi:hypothetical protein
MKGLFVGLSKSTVFTVSAFTAAAATATTFLTLFSTGVGVDHIHPKGLNGRGGRLIEVIVEQNNKFYEVWGLTCECGYVHVDDCPLAGGVRESVGPKTGWTDVDVTTLYQGRDAKDQRRYVHDYRSPKFRS